MSGGRRGETPPPRMPLSVASPFLFRGTGHFSCPRVASAGPQDGDRAAQPGAVCAEGRAVEGRVIDLWLHGRLIIPWAKNQLRACLLNRPRLICNRFAVKPQESLSRTFPAQVAGRVSVDGLDGGLGCRGVSGTASPLSRRTARRFHRRGLRARVVFGPATPRF